MWWSTEKHLTLPCWWTESGFRDDGDGDGDGDGGGDGDGDGDGDGLKLSPTSLTHSKTHRRIQTTMRLPLSNDFSPEIRSKFSLLYLCLFMTENQWNIFGNCLSVELQKFEVEESFFWRKFRMI